MSERIKVGVWGLGRAGNGMHFNEIDKFPEMFELVAGCDNDPERREKALERKPNIKVYENAEEFLADENIELVVIATRSPQHIEHSHQALAAGKYVFHEKPIACDYKSALTLKEADAKYPNRLYIRHNRRFESAFEHIREIIKGGKLGNIYEVRLNRQNFQWRADWQTLLDFGGGQLLNWGPHIVDHALQFLESPVKEVWSDLKMVASLGDAEDHVKIILKGENNRVVDLEISGGCPIAEPVYVVRGSRGSLVCQDETRIKMKYLNPAFPEPTGGASSENPPLSGGFGGAVNPVWIEDDLGVAPATGDIPESIWKYMYKSIRCGETFPITLDEALEVMRILDLVKQGAISSAK